MKKQLLLIGLIFGMFTAFSQEVTKNGNTTEAAKVDTTETVADTYCPHRILLNFGGGYANNTLKPIKDVLHLRCSYSAMAELGYTYFFHRNVGIGIGVGINHFGYAAKVNETNTIKDLYDPRYAEGDLYDLTYAMDNFKIKQGTWAIEVPLTVQFEKKFGGRKGIYAGVGVKGYFPLASKITFPDGIIQPLEIYDQNLNITYSDPIDIHLTPIELKGAASKQKMRCSIDVLGEFGGIFGVSRGADIYLGVYASYGFLNILPKEQFNLDNLNDIKAGLNQLCGTYVNTKEKFNLVQVGLKLGFHFLPCKDCGNDEYMRDHKRRYMDKMMAKKDEPIIVTNTIQEYYYVVPTIAQDLLEESANDPVKKKALLDLAQSLSNIKILFDLDKDIPKLDDYKYDHIRRSSELLRENPDLKVIVTGYTSPEGSKDHNQDLGHRRAIAVRKEFINRGVPENQIFVQNYTADDPQHKIDIPDKDYKEQRAVIFKIEKK